MGHRILLFLSLCQEKNGKHLWGFHTLELCIYFHKDRCKISIEFTLYIKYSLQ